MSKRWHKISLGGLLLSIPFYIIAFTLISFGLNYATYFLVAGGISLLTCSFGSMVRDQYEREENEIMSKLKGHI